jgi:hypothetical protein
MSNDEATDFTPFAEEIFTDLIGELTTRFPGLVHLSDPDRSAVLTAVMKGAWRGILRGIAIHAHAFNEEADAQAVEDPDADVVRVDTQIIAGPEPDMWADSYADGEGA